MTARIEQVDLLVREEIVKAPVLPAAPSSGCEDRSFGLPTALYVGMFGMLFAYLAVMTIGFAADGLVVPMAVNFIFVAAFGVVPGLWATMKPAKPKSQQALAWQHFKAHGIDTLTGRTGAGEATTLVLLLPACILFWGIATVTIAALV